jgi:hypothetical protein
MNNDDDHVILEVEVEYSREFDYDTDDDNNADNGYENNRFNNNPQHQKETANQPVSSYKTQQTIEIHPHTRDSSLVSKAGETKLAGEIIDSNAT